MRFSANWQALRAAGVKLLVNLHESAHSSDTLAKNGVRCVHLPVQDFTPPTQEQLQEGTREMAAALARGETVAVHCGAGLGRTGTLVACHLLRCGQAASAAEAIARVRAARPGSVETDAQENAVAQFAKKM